MLCPYCAVGIRLDIKERQVYQLKDKIIEDDRKRGIEIVQGYCPECEELIVEMRKGTYRWIDDAGEIIDIHEDAIIFPKSANKRLSQFIPLEYQEDFREAYAVSSLSPKASAALSRRLLQRLFHEKYNVIERNLSKEIDTFIEIEGIPSNIREEVDAIRQIGNFAAHPMKYTNAPGEIVDVEPGEANWLLEVIEDLFDLTFVEPKKKEERTTQLNQKLASLGKQPLKS